MFALMRLASLVVLALLLGCRSFDAPSGSSAQFSADPPAEVGGSRPARVHRPQDYDPTRSYPLVLLLHGYGWSPDMIDVYFGMSAEVDVGQYVLVLPEGTFDDDGFRFWNATPACCNHYHSPVNDVTYLGGLIDEVQQHYNIDSRRVYLVGHSNGGFMSYRMACQAADRFTAMVSVEGATFATVDECQPSEAVSVLHIHGVQDSIILFGGGSIRLNAYPSAPESARRFAARAGCNLDAATTHADIDIVNGPAGLTDTQVLTYSEGCDPGVDVSLWTIPQGGHIPAFNSSFVPSLLDWLFAHRK
ncbi:MAG: alpha/beta hydrolase-fold protein [Myxococcota bacterium]|nr:alpha/beta hydrolase-fold protein [Myxococcota bacterium]